MKDINNPHSNLSKVIEKMAANSNLTKILFKYSGWNLNPTLATTWQGKDFVIAMRFRLVQLIAVVFLLLDSTFFFLEMRKTENTNTNITTYLLELTTSIGVFFGYEIWYQRKRLMYQARKEIEPKFYKVLTITVEATIPFICILIQSLHLQLGEAYNNVYLIEHIPFMLLSILYLRFWLCFYASLIAILGRLLLLFIISFFTEVEKQLLNESWGLTEILLSGFIMGTIALLLRKMIESAIAVASEKTRLHDIFGRFVSKDVADQIVSKDLKIGGDNVNASVLFLDIRNFTHRSSTMTPEDAVAFLNQVFNFTVAEVEKSGGMVNKFLGDGFMAVFGAPLSLPNSCNASVLCAIGIFEKLQLFNVSRLGENVSLGIGINYGPMVAGVMGTNTRKEYTVIGDIVNTASRIESLNKEFSTSLLISQSVYDNLDANLKDQFESMPPTMVKGKDQPISIYKKI
ncbi:MAG: adenylate/guanylate cyclase domain-containing protein [Planctomycetota bacterium]|nr:MAG: adenylate/guanylate cyclase domain-containing protein [Planctomycetota bacterium]RLS97889.1 MAG: adenylate/guanylate cyclase domain-containing protein [Planctomycetota bacterium]